MDIAVSGSTLILFFVLRKYSAASEQASSLDSLQQQAKRTTVQYPNVKPVGIILGTAIGDAKGIPYETLSYEECLVLLPGATCSTFEKCSPENRCVFPCCQPSILVVPCLTICCCFLLFYSILF
jgi:hypothetical protein